MRNDKLGRRAAKESYGFYDVTAWSLGMQLVHTLVAQLGGTLSRAPGPGTVHTVQFSPEAS